MKYSKDKLKAKRFRKEEEFELLNPEYEVTSDEIRDYIIDNYKKTFG